MRRYLFLFVILLLVLSACSTPQQTAPTSTVPPEPTNTPLPRSNTVATLAEPCTVAGQHREIDAAFAEYQAGRSVEREAVGELNDWFWDVSAEINQSCASSPIEVGTTEELTALLDKLYAGGNIIYVRHTHTDRSRTDSDTTFGSCDTQRILSDQGREEALMIRNNFNQLALPIDALISTQYCRTLETAVLAFGVPRVILRSTLFEEFNAWLSAEPDPGTNTIIVAHIGTIRNNIGLDATFEEGDSLVYAPDGDGGFEFIGRIGLYDWPLLADINREQ